MNLNNTKYLMSFLVKANLIALSFLSLSYAMEEESVQGQREQQANTFINALIDKNPNLLPKLPGQALLSVTELKNLQLENSCDGLKNFRDIVNAQLSNDTPYHRDPADIMDFREILSSSRNIDLSQLNLSYYNISTLPIEISVLTHLQILNCFLNKIKEIPSQIGNLTNLTHLSLFSNQLSTLPQEIGKLTKLTHLNCRANQITQLPSQIGNLKQLMLLDLSNNPLIMLPFTSIEKLNRQFKIIISRSAPVTNYFFYIQSTNDTLTLSLGDIRNYINAVNNEKRWVLLAHLLTDTNLESKKFLLRKLAKDVRQLIWQYLHHLIEQERNEINPFHQQYSGSVLQIGKTISF
jgi:Leucine-rich repeat (LRR) protein